MTDKKPPTFVCCLEESLRNAIEALGGLSESAYADTTTATESPSAGIKVRDALDALVLARPGGKKAAKEVMTPLRHALTGQKVRPLSPRYLPDGSRESSLTQVRGSYCRSAPACRTLSASSERRNRSDASTRPSYGQRGERATAPSKTFLIVATWTPMLRVEDIAPLIRIGERKKIGKSRAIPVLSLFHRVRAASLFQYVVAIVGATLVLGPQTPAEQPRKPADLLLLRLLLLPRLRISVRSLHLFSPSSQSAVVVCALFCARIVRSSSARSASSSSLERRGGVRRGAESG